MVVKVFSDNHKVGDKVLIEKTHLVPLQIEGENIENVYYLNEQFIKGYIK